MTRTRLLNIVLVVGLLDAALLLVLLYVAFVDRNEDAIRVIGPIHGVGYVILLALTANGAQRGFWKWWFPLAVLITGGPLGSLLGEIKLRERGPARR